MHLPRLSLALLLVLWPLGALADALPRGPQLRLTPPSHTSVVNRIATDAKGTVLVTGADDKTIRIWSLADGAALGTLGVPVAPGVTGEVAAVAVSPDASQVAASIRRPGAEGLYASTILIYRRATGEIVKSIDPDGQLITALAFSTDGARLAAGAYRGGLSLYAAKDWSREANDSDYRDEISDLDYAADGSLAVAVNDGTLRVYDAGLNVVGDGPAPHRGAPERIGFSPDGKKLVVGYADEAQVDVVASPSLRRLSSPDVSGIDNGDVAAVGFLADNQTVIAAGSYNTPEERMPVFLWTGKAKRRMADAAGDTVMDAVALPDGGFALASADGAVAAFGTDGTLRFRKERASADMRSKIGANFTVSSDAKRVRFGLGVEGQEPWVFDVSRLSFKPSPDPEKGLHEADMTSLPVENWSQSEEFAYRGVRLSHVEGETAQSLAIGGADKAFLLGTSRFVRKYAVDGLKVWETPVSDVAWGLNLSDDARLAVAALGDGTLRWYRTSDGVELLAIFVDAAEHRWIAWTPRGYFAASPGGEGLMGWQVDHGWDRAPDVFPASQFHDRFYRPDIVTTVLDTLDEDEAIRAANDAAGTAPEDDGTAADHLPPLIRILSPEPGTGFSTTTLRLSYRAEVPDGAKLERIDVLVDGRPQGTRGVSAVEDAGDEGEIEVHLPPRAVTVSLIAWSGGMPSVPATVALDWAGVAGLDNPKAMLHALLVGVSAYQLKELTLNFADDDARDLGAALKAESQRGYAGSDIRVITDGEATAKAVRDGIAWLAEVTGPDDTALLFLAGHGVTLGGRRFYFLPADADPAPARIAATAVTDLDIREGLAKISGKAVFLIDACHGAAGLSAGDVTGVVNRMARADTGVVMFASSTGQEVSFEDAAWKNGAFTEALLEGLSGKADYEKDGRITIAELNLWLSSRVAQLTQNRQNAVMLKPDTIRDFALAAP